MSERVDGQNHRKNPPVFPGGFGLGEIPFSGERFHSLDSLVSHFWRKTKNILVSIDYHDTLTEPEKKKIPPRQVGALQLQTRRLNFLLGNSVDIVVNTIGPIKNLKTDTGLGVIANSGLDFQASPTSPVVQLFPEREETFTHIRDRAAARLAEQGGPVELITRNDRASFIPVDLERMTPELAAALLHTVIPEHEAALLRVFANTDAGKISISPGVFKQDGAAELTIRNGKDPAETTYIHIGDDSSDIPLVVSPFGRNYFVTPNNASDQVKEYASFHAGSPAPDTVPDVLREVADAIGKRVLNETMMAISGDAPIGEYLAAVDTIRNWFVTSITGLTEAFHTLPTPTLIFENLQNLFGATITLELRQQLLHAVFDTSRDLHEQIATVAGIERRYGEGEFDSHAFDDHPFTGPVDTYPGMTFLARRGKTAGVPVLTDAISVSDEYEAQALADSARLTQALGERMIDALGEDINDVVFMSIYRGGLFPAVGLQQFLKTRTGAEIPHYSVVPHKLNETKVISVNGEQKNSQYTLAGEDLAYVLDRHPQAKIVFVDGWIGSGQTISNIRDELTMKQNDGAMGNDFYFASLIDPLGITDFSATKTDRMLGWNLWPYNDFTYGFFHKNNQPGNTGLAYITPDTDSFPVTENRLQRWLTTLQAVEPGIGADIPAASLSADAYIQRCRQATGFSEEDYDMARIKLGINESFIRIRNDNGNFWKYLLVHSDFLSTPEMQKVLEVAKSRDVRVFHSAEIPCIALVSQDQFPNPDVISQEILLSDGRTAISGHGETVYTAE